MQRDNPEELIRKARSKMQPGFFGKMFSSKQGRLDEALELFQAAANMYKIRKDWNNAGVAYEECANLEVQLGSQSAYSQYKEAAHCFSFVDQERSNRNLNNAIQFLENHAKFQQAGKMTQEIAHQLEIDFDYAGAIEKYKKAAELFKLEGQSCRSLEQQCSVKVADLMCISNHKDMLIEAPKIYEKVGMQYLTVNLLKTSAKDMFFKCVVCNLAQKDEITAQNNLAKFIKEDPTFEGTREYQFLEKAIECVTEPSNPEGFREAMAKLKSYRDLDKWKINMFDTILTKIEEEDEDMK